jgi:2-C-methyl-D-erythritol 4-phosphate cytidylyltransferase
MNAIQHVVAIVVAAGRSSRMGGGANKVLFSLAGRPVLSYSLSVLQSCKAVTQVAVVGRDEDREIVRSICEQWCPKAVPHFVLGGAERFESVKNGVEYFASSQPHTVIIQDAARPFLQERYITDSLHELEQVPGCVVGVPLKDTLKQTSKDARVVLTHDRNQYWLAQTPQIFQFKPLLEAYRACTPPPYPTDDGQVLELAQQPVTMIEGSYHNIKITNPEDIALAAALIHLQSS